MAVEMKPVILTQRVEVAPGLIIIRVTPEGWQLPEFSPGQFAVLALPGTAPRASQADAEEKPPKDADKLIRRAYSVASSSQARSYLEFYVALVSTGALTPRIFALEDGGRMWMSNRISGMLTLEDVPEDSHIVLVATGILVVVGLVARFASIVFYLKYYLQDGGESIFLIFDKTALLTSCGLIGQLIGALMTPMLALKSRIPPYPL